MSDAATFFITTCAVGWASETIGWPGTIVLIIGSIVYSVLMAGIRA